MSGQAQFLMTEIGKLKSSLVKIGQMMVFGESIYYLAKWLQLSIS